jgi:hypothetical protein
VTNHLTRSLRTLVAHKTGRRIVVRLSFSIQMI